MRQKGFAPILIILIVLIAVGGAYYLGTVKKNVSPNVVATITPGQTIPIASPGIKPKATTTPSPLSTKNEVLSLATNFLNAVIAQDTNKARSFLTEPLKTEYRNTALPSGYKTFEILNEFHSTEEENNFYSNNQLLFDVKLYQNNDVDGTIFILPVIKENNTWKIGTWPPQPK